MILLFLGFKMVLKKSFCFERYQRSKVGAFWLYIFSYFYHYRQQNLILSYLSSVLSPVHLYHCPHLLNYTSVVPGSRCLFITALYLPNSVSSREFFFIIYKLIPLRDYNVCWKAFILIVCTIFSILYNVWDRFKLQYLFCFHNDLWQIPKQ